MGSTCALASLLLQGILHAKVNLNIETSSLLIPTLIASGAFAAVSGTNIRTVIMNVISPEFRGSAIALMNVLGCIGRGVGPSLTGLYMIYTHTERVEAIRVCLHCWVFSGLVLSLGGITIAKDED